jgi:MFS family permease
MAASTTSRGAVEVSAAVRASYVAFIAAGFAAANWASRIPQVRTQLSLSSAQLGIVLLAIAAGSVVALPLAGSIVHRLNSRRTVSLMAVLLSVGLAVVAIGYQVGVITVIVGLFVFGFATGAWDVSMNVQGATVERHLGRAIMPRFHAGYSVGTVAGALVGVIMVLAHVPVTAHLLCVALTVAIGVPLAIQSYLPDEHDAPDPSPQERKSRPPRAALARWREPRTLLIGVFVLAFAFAEGAGNDWISLSVIDTYHAPAVVGTLTFAVFLASMTAARWVGPSLLDRYGRVAVVRAIAVVGTIGVLLFVFSPHVVLALFGTLLWGVGASLGFPVGMSAAADEPAAAAARVSVVASIGYCAFLGGPPFIGFLGEHITVEKALISVAVLFALASAVAGATRPLASAVKEN